MFESGTIAAVLAAALATEGPQEELTTGHVAGKVHVIQGPGGNVGVHSGPDGVLLVDDKFERLAARIEQAIAEIAGEGQPLFLVNTHWHGDHTGANAHFGEEAVILAHANVRRRLAGDASIGGRVSEDETPAAALPVVTYEDGVSVHFNGEEVRLIHVPRAHTDGDTAVWFTGSNVVHMGDLYFDVGYPFVDLESGGDVEGLVRGVRGLLERLPEDVRVISGHGRVTGIAELREYVSMLETVIGRVREALAAGKHVDAMMAEGLTEDLDERWGGFSFVPPRRFVETVAASLER